MQVNYILVNHSLCFIGFKRFVKTDQENTKCFHNFVIASKIVYDHRFYHFFRTIIKNNLFNEHIDTAMLTIVESRKQFCVTKEKYEEICTNGSGANKISVGDDIENFVHRVIEGKIKQHELGLKLYNGFSGIRSYHLTLLTPEEKGHLSSNDETYLKSFRPWFARGDTIFNKHIVIPNRTVDVPKEEMNASESKRKYALSHCIRKTYFIVTEEDSLKTSSRFKLTYQN